VRAQLPPVAFHQRCELDLIASANRGDDRRVLANGPALAVRHRMDLLDDHDVRRPSLRRPTPGPVIALRTTVESSDALGEDND
jgi:hypothetical protein